MPITSPHTQALLHTHAHQGESNDCGPYSVTIVVNALRASGLNPEQVARRMNQPRLRGILPIIRRIPNWATFPWGVADALQEYGLPARWHAFSNEDNLRERLRIGEIVLPIIGEWRPSPWAHIAPLVAWDQAKGWGFVDPLIPVAQIYWRPAELFSRQWRAYFRMLVSVPSPLTAEEARFPTLGEPAD